MGYYGYSKIAEAICPCGKHKINIYKCYYEEHSDYIYKGDGARIAYINNCNKYKFYTFGYFNTTMTINISYDQYKKDYLTLDKINFLKENINEEKSNLENYKYFKYNNLIMSTDLSTLPKYYQDIYNYLQLIQHILFWPDKYDLNNLLCTIDILNSYTSINKLKTSIKDGSFIKIFNTCIMNNNIKNKEKFIKIFNNIVFDTRWKTNSIKIIRLILNQISTVYDNFINIYNIHSDILKNKQEEYKTLCDVYYDNCEKYENYLKENIINIKYNTVIDTNDNDKVIKNPNGYGYIPEAHYGSEEDLNSFIKEIRKETV